MLELNPIELPFENISQDINYISFEAKNNKNGKPSDL